MLESSEISQTPGIMAFIPRCKSDQRSLLVWGAQPTLCVPNVEAGMAVFPKQRL